MVEKKLKKLQAKKHRVTNGFNTGTRDMKLKTAYRRKKNWSADADQSSFLLNYGPINDIRSYPFSLPTFIIYSIYALKSI